MNLPTTQKLFRKQGTVGMVEIAALCKNCPISDIVTQLSEKLPSAKVTAVQQVVEGRMDTLHSFRRFSLEFPPGSVCRVHGRLRDDDGQRKRAYS